MAAFRAAITPIVESARMGPLLAQFPWSFRFSARAEERLARISDAFAELERVVEVRHASWDCEAARLVLARHGGICNIDQPRLRDCLGPAEHLLGSIAYVRLHGRNSDAWFAEGQPPHERYNYLYTEKELEEWAGRLNELWGKARDLYIFANNHYRGQGVVNALQLRAMLERRSVDVPESLLRSYPPLAVIANATLGKQGELFER